jgi:superfamily II DNA or RNA helicase
VPSTGAPSFGTGQEAPTWDAATLQSPRGRLGGAMGQEHEQRAQIEQLRGYYRTGQHDLAAAFFAPCLGSCTLYRRAVAYFSSTALVTWSAILPRLAAREGTVIRLLISPELSSGDRAALGQATNPAEQAGLLQRLVDQVVLEALELRDHPGDTALRLRLFTWLVATSRLELRFAIPEHLNEPGIFHEKIGIFDFPWGTFVAFTGSANETISGHRTNFESLDVFRSWLAEDAERVRVKIEQFEDAWNMRAPGLRILRLSPEALERVRVLAPEESPLLTGHTVAAAAEQPLWQHQQDAIREFLEHRAGILEMATGTGKTRTALKICEALLHGERIGTVILATDGTDLLAQWNRHLLGLVRRSPVQLTLLKHFAEYHERDRFLMNPRGKILLVSRPNLGPALRSLRTSDAHRTLLIHDEVHRLGSTANREKLAGLSSTVAFRLGLSATPEREYDQAGTDFITDHVGPIIFRYGLDQAIEDGILTAFDYIPLEYQPTADDRQRLRQEHARAAASRKAGHPVSPEELAMRLAAVYKTSLAKLPVFRDFIQTRRELLERCIIFCETREYGEAVLAIVHRHRPDFHTYFAEEDAETLARFANGELECLLTCHRLSEGIDIQNLRNVILFSSARSRLETIQRMGRCLRSDPGNLSKKATVVDFVRVNPDAHDDEDNADDERRAWLAHLATIRPRRSER